MVINYLIISVIFRQATISASEIITNTSNSTNSSESVIEISGSLNEFISNGEFVFEDIQIKAFPPNKTFNLTILTDPTPVYYPDFLLNVTPNEKNESGVYAYVIPVNLRSCIVILILFKEFQLFCC